MEGSTSPARIMRPRIVAHVERATNADIVHLTTQAARDSSVRVSWPEEFPREEAPLLVWELLRSRQYVADVEGQVVKAPRVLMFDGVGDCKSYAVFAVKALQAAGWDVALRFVKNEPGNNYQHVYVTASMLGEQVIVDGVFDQFNAEPLHFGGIDIPCRS